MNLMVFLLEKTEGVLRRFRKYILKKTSNPFNKVEQWYLDDPRNLKRTTFGFLDENSIVFDLGGYQGEWTSDIYARYNCTVYIFEPVTEYIEIIKQRFQKNKKIKTQPFGLSSENSEPYITINEFASTIEKNSSNQKQEKIRLVKFTDFTLKNNITKVDLIKINIEGAEYSLLKHVIESGFIKNINTLLIQFHHFNKSDPATRIMIQNSFNKTHNKVFDYPFVWECWQLKNNKMH